MSSELELKLTLGFLILLAAGGPLLAYLIDKKIRKSRDLKIQHLTQELKSSILNAIKNDALNNLKDVEDYYASVFANSLILDDEHYPTLSALLDAKLQLATADYVITERAAWITKLDELISTLNEKHAEKIRKAPFSGIPDPERGLLEDLYEITNAKTDNFVFSKLEELASTITLRRKESEKYIDEKQESLKLAKRGLWATIVFSIVSILLAIYFYMNGN